MVDTKEVMNKVTKGKVKSPLEGSAKGVDSGIKSSLGMKAKMSGNSDAESTKIIKKILGK